MGHPRILKTEKLTSYICNFLITILAKQEEDMAIFYLTERESLINDSKSLQDISYKSIVFV